MKMTPIRAIRAKCIDCCAGQPKEVRLCSIEKCPLYPYRMGHRPKDDNLTAEMEKGEKSSGYVQIFD
jgi:hypothetical protein